MMNIPETFLTELGRKWWRNIPRPGHGSRRRGDSAGTKMNNSEGWEGAKDNKGVQQKVLSRPSRGTFVTLRGMLECYMTYKEPASRECPFCSPRCPCMGTHTSRSSAPKGFSCLNSLGRKTETDFSGLPRRLRQGQSWSVARMRRGSGIPSLMSSCARDTFPFSSATHPGFLFFPPLPLDLSSSFPSRHRACGAVPAHP